MHAPQSGSELKKSNRSSPNSAQVLCVLLGAQLTYFFKQRFHFREKWVHEIFLERDSKSEFILAEDLLDKGDPEKCHQYFRMSSTQFYTILELIRHKIERQDTNWRSAISAKRRLILTIR